MEVKNMQEVFNGKPCGFSTRMTDEQVRHGQHAINHVDALADALAVMTDLALIKWGNLDAEVYAEIEKAKAALAAYRGEA